MISVAAAYFLGTIGLAVTLFAARRACKTPRIRLALLLLPIFLLLHLVYLIFVPVCPGIFTFLTPYEPDGEWATTDTHGHPCRVTIQSKARCSTIPPGEHPRIRLESSGVHGVVIHVMDTDWRFAPGVITPVPGGLEIYQTVAGGWGTRFLLHQDHWSEETIVPKDW